MYIRCSALTYVVHRTLGTDICWPTYLDTYSPKPAGSSLTPQMKPSQATARVLASTEPRRGSWPARLGPRKKNSGRLHSTGWEGLGGRSPGQGESGLGWEKSGPNQVPTPQQVHQRPGRVESQLVPTLFLALFVSTWVLEYQFLIFERINSSSLSGGTTL